MSDAKNLEYSLLNLLCRICGKEDKYCIKVFSEEGIQQQLQKKIRLCLPIVISEEDEMPKQVCINCLSKLESTYELYTMCKLAQDDIRKKLNCLNVARSQGNINSEGSYFLTIEEKCKTLSEERPIQIGGSIIKLVKPTNVTNVVPQSVSNSTHAGINNITSNVNIQGHAMNSNSHGQNVVAVSPKQIPPGNTTTLSDMIPQVIVPTRYVSVSHVPSEQLTQTIMPVQGQYPRLTQPQTSKQSNSQYEQHAVQQPVYQQTVMQQPNSNTQSKVIETRSLSTNNTPQSRSANKMKRVQENNKDREVTHVQSAQKKRLSECKYCHKMFSDDIIDHHVNLHLHQSFFTCIDCNKNFRSEDALEKHRCRIIVN